MSEIQVSIDDELCAASAMCQRIVPDVFDVPDDADWALVKMPVVSDPDQIALVREAAEACPTQGDRDRSGVVRLSACEGQARQPPFSFCEGG